PPRGITLAAVNTLSHGKTSTAVLVAAGDTIFATGPGGGPVRAFAPDGRFLGFASREHVATGRHLAARDLVAAWTGPRSVSVAWPGLVREAPLDGAPNAVGVLWDGSVWVAVGATFSQRDGERTLGTRRAPLAPSIIVPSSGKRWLAAAGPEGGFFLGRSDGD